MFLLNLGYQWSNHELVDGVIINASGVHMEQAVRRDKIGSVNWKLFDPQFYLKCLDYEQSKKACERLSTYPWFGGSTVEYDSGEFTPTSWFNEHKQNVQWDNIIPTDDNEIAYCIKECLKFQEDIGATHLIAPIPMIENPEDEFAVQLKWIDVLEKVKDDFEKPVLVTVAFLDNLFLYDPPLSNKLFQTIMDNLSVRVELEGVYIVPVQTNDASPKLDDKNVVEGILHMCSIMSENEKLVIVNYADSLGYACIGAGATAFGGGYSNKEKRMCLNDYTDATGGRSYPRFYSHNLISDFYSNRDLTKIKDVGLLRLIKDDITNVSKDLFDELANGGIANNLPNWRESMNNITASKQHRIVCMNNHAGEFLKLNSTEERDTHILTWLQNAEAYRLLLDSKLKNNPLSDDARHIPVWSSAYEDFIKNR